MKKTRKTRKSGEVYDSLKHAAAGMGVPLELLQECKALGAPGFVGSRVRADEVRQWLVENPVSDNAADSLVGLKKKFLRSQIAKADFQLATLKGEHISIAEVCTTITVLVSEINGLIRCVENDIPAAIMGLDIPSAVLVIRKKFDAMREKIYAPLAEYEKAKAALEKAK